MKNMKTMTGEELFGKDAGGLQYYLCFLAGKAIIHAETLYDRVTTIEETKSLCKEALKYAGINPEEDLVTLLYFPATAFASSDEGIQFCENFDKRTDKSTFTGYDSNEVEEIVNKSIEEFIHSLE